MLTSRKRISRYIASACLPYIFLALVLLTAVLFAQQASRFAELALLGRLSLPLIADVSTALLPGVLVFTLPMAVLAGINIGFARMGNDSEVIAMKAAGIGAWSLLWPALLLGLFASFAAAYLQFKELPRAARDLKHTALLGALARLESPVEPGTFTTDIPGYVIYVREGDKVQGSWGRVFIFAQQPDSSKRIFTARSGRIDSSADKSELVLTDAASLRIPPTEADDQSYIVERLEQLRVAIDTGREALMKSVKDVAPEELGWTDLRREIQTGSPTERQEAERTLQRRIALSVAPLVFSLVAGAIGLRVRRGGRSVGVLISLTLVIMYYLCSLLGESLSKVGTVSPRVGASMATGLMLFLSFFFLVSNRVRLVPRIWRLPRRPSTKPGSGFDQRAHTHGIGIWGFPSLLDANLFRTLILSFLIGFISLVSVFVIFTLFELWRFIIGNHVKAALVAKYLLFLLPLIATELFPATTLIAVLVTYSLMARRSEAIAWWASGQSVYRLMLPGLLFAALAGAGSWVIQEQLMPSANLRQDALRAQIKGREARAITGSGRQWLSSINSQKLYSYEFDDVHGTLREPTVYELDAQAVHLKSVTTGSVGYWKDDTQLVVKDFEIVDLTNVKVGRRAGAETVSTGVDPPQLFKPTIDKPSQLSAQGLNRYLDAARQRGIDAAALAVALQRKYAAPFGVILMALLGIPLALSFGRKGAIIALCVAVGVSVAYWGLGGGFQQLGNHGLLPPAVAGWSPLIIFAAAGTYFLSKVRT